MPGEQPPDRDLAGARLRALLDSTDAIWRSHDLEEMANAIVKHAARLVPGTDASMNVIPPGTPDLVEIIAGSADWIPVHRAVRVENTISGRAIQSRRSIESTTASQESAFTEDLTRANVDTLRVVPLMTPGSTGSDDVLGVLAFLRPGSQAFSEEERALMDEFGKSVSLALHRVRLLEQSRREASRLQFGLDVALALSSSLEPRRVIHDLLVKSLEAVQGDRATLSSISDDELTIEATQSSEGHPSWSGRSYAMSYLDQQPLVKRAIESKKPVVGGRLDPDAAAPEFRPELEATAQTATLPLMLQDTIAGLLVVSRASDEAFDDEDVLTLQVMGNAAMLALRNARLYEETERARQQLSALARRLQTGVDVAVDLASRLDPEQVLRRLLERAVQSVDADRATLADVGVDEVIVADSIAVDGDAVPLGTRWPIQSIPMLRQVVLQREPYLDSTQAADFPETEPMAEVEHLLTIPLVVRDRVVAILGVSRRRLEPFTRDDLATIQQVGSVAVLARNNALLYSQLEQAANRLQVGVDTALDLAAELDTSEVVSRLLARASDVAQADQCVLMLVQGEELIVEDSYDASSGLKPIPRGAAMALAEQPLVLEAVSSGRAVQARAVNFDALGEFADQVKRLRHFASVPLVFRGRVLAMMNLSRFRDEPFSDGELNGLNQIGQVAVLALRNAAQFDELQQASTSKSEFLRLAAHELRTPLTVITGYISMLLDGSFGEGPRSWSQTLEVIAAKTTELAAIVESLLVAARMQADSLMTKATRLDLVDAVAAAVLRAQPAVELAGGMVSVDLPSSPVVTTADPDQVSRILDNLINNAITYSPERVDIKVALTLGAGVVRIRVADRGRGIPKAAHESIFDEFVRVEDPDSGYPPGTGLGLYISRGLARRHQGDLRLLESSPGRGSVFELELPLRDA